MKKDFIIVLAWPEGMVTAAGAWYDRILSKKGKYRVGHSALALVESTSGKVKYFDFGRYHTPYGYGRVRDIETDLDLAISEIANIKNGVIKNIDKILIEIESNKANHGEGKLYASVLEGICFKKAYKRAKNMQDKGMLKYGPLVPNGTNCSRFVAEVMRASDLGIIKYLRLRFPFCISPSPKRNVSIGNNNYYIVDNGQCTRVIKNKIKAYFTTIEKV